MPHITVEHLSKYYQVHQKAAGLVGSLRAFFNRQYRDVKAVDDVNFTIEAGEMVGFLGPNGAGKTTTLKVLSGLLYPTRGRVSVLGYTPYERKREFLEQFTLVMGNKNQLIWDLPAMESFLVNRAIYDIPKGEYEAIFKELNDLLELEPLLKKQVRKLSLGERMKCELAAALLHRPQILFLDEPTIGLDVTMQVTIRNFIKAYNQRYGATVILTSHYMADVTELTKRVIVIDQGRILYDGYLQQLVEQVAPYKLLTIVMREPAAAEVLARYGEVEKLEGIKATLRVERGRASEIASRLLTHIKLDDVLIEEPPVEDIIRQVFADSKATRESEKKLETERLRD
ncbi:MAG: ATP-binding cassette domain-containing protein [Chloroflexi bacterium]|nr:ATP-binding cassette domain-containing protein [Chloroflexota bacterium]